MRLAAIFVAVCILLIAVSVGAVAFLAFGLGLAEAGGVALAALIGLSFYNLVSTRLNLRSMVGTQLSDLSRATVDLARQVAEMGRRLAALESKVEGNLSRTRAATDPLAVELGELGTLVKQLAETVAAHENVLVKAGPAMSAHAPLPVAEPVPHKAPGTPVKPPQPALEAEQEPMPALAAAGNMESRAAEELLVTIRSAIDANRVDLYLQPIVTLPQRKVRYYEAMSRLRTDTGDIMPAADFIGPAEKSGLLHKIDNLVLFRCVQVVRRLLLKNRDIGLFCNVSGSTLTNAETFQQLLEFLDANRAIAPSLVLEFTQSTVRAMGPMEHESLAALTERGFRFSLDNVSDLSVNARELAARGFRFIKVPASLLLHRAGALGADIHPADLSDLLGRVGIDLIAEKIESEGMVVDLLDYDVRYGQGFLFAAPRPVRAEALQGIADRSDVVARDTTVGDAPAGRPSQTSEAGAPAESGTSKRAASLAQLARGGASRI